MKAAQDPEERIESLRASAAQLEDHIGQVFLGQSEAVELIVLGVLSGGHLLLEGVPGLGKTTLVRAVASAMQLDFRRIQFTPDLLPADFIGSRILDEDSSGHVSFRFEKGPLFANVILADEINRATPRTQSALLEAMQEGQVTVAHTSLDLGKPFHVFATQNPIEMEGTYPLPEAQLDRFMAKIELSPPSQSDLERILSETTGSLKAEPEPCLEKSDLIQLCELVRDVPVSKEMVSLAARLVRATAPSSKLAPERVRQFVRHGASPRGGQSLLLMSKARALLEGRLHVTADDLAALAAPTLRHRIVFGFEGEASGIHPDELILDAWNIVSGG